MRPRFFEVAKQVVEITEGAIFVAHNVRFDYGFMHHAFRRLGYSYVRKQLCTVKLSRKLYPGLESYSLGNLCREFGIENPSAHRAWSDAAATLELFQILSATERGEELPMMLKAEITANKLPPKLDPQLVDALPNEAGVYYFFDEYGHILYVGKSTHIRKRVLSHFSSAHKTLRRMRMLQAIADISFTLTGSELIALLFENEEIKRHQPPFNRAQRRTKFKFGIYEETNGAGYKRLSVKELKREKEAPLAPFPERGGAEGALRRKLEEFELCLSLCGLANCRSSCFYRQIDRCHGAGIGQESPEAYNERVEEAIKHLIYGSADFLVIGKGRKEGEASVVSVQNGIYRGFGYIDLAFVAEDPEAIRQAIAPKKESPDVRQIIQGYVRKHPKEVVPMGRAEPAD